MPIRQKHQGVESHRKPDIVVVSHQTAREVFEDGGKPSKNDGSKSKPSKFTSDAAKQKPKGRFEWPDVLSTFKLECKRKKNLTPPNYENLKITLPNGKYMVYGKKSGNDVEPTGSTPSATGATPSASGAQSGSNQRMLLGFSLLLRC